mmetsp:Transcript_18925/g.72182  ORF Transcript_18925/g.72182 Transcript_18925/m.72182 type:complete len:237 (+) Transcript_18925:2981-3691(+)
MRTSATPTRRCSSSRSRSAISSRVWIRNRASATVIRCVDTTAPRCRAFFASAAAAAPPATATSMCVAVVLRSTASKAASSSVASPSSVRRACISEMAFSRPAIIRLQARTLALSGGTAAETCSSARSGSTLATAFCSLTASALRFAAAAARRCSRATASLDPAPAALAAEPGARPSPLASSGAPPPPASPAESAAWATDCRRRSLAASSSPRTPSLEVLPTGPEDSFRDDAADCAD